MAGPGGISPALVGSYLNDLVASLRNANTPRSIDHLSSLAAQVLASLVNPHNVSLLTVELLKAPALWQRGAGQETVLQVSHRVVTIFAFAADRRRTANLSPYSPGLSSMAFTHAVIQGLNDQEKHLPTLGLPRPSRYKDLMVFAGLLMGFANKKDQPPAPIDSTYFENNLQGPSLEIVREFVKVNFEPREWQPAVVLALTIIFPGLPAVYQRRLPSDGILVMAMQALTGPDGLDGGQILAEIDSGITDDGKRFDWPSTASSFAHFQQHQQKAFVLNMGSLAKIMGYAIRTAKDANIVVQLLGEMVGLSEALLKNWQENKLSNADITMEAVVFTPQTLAVTWPALWGFFRWTLYSFTTILTEVITRGLIDQGLGAHNNGILMASMALTVLRNLAFISVNKGADAFEGYNYVRLAALDKLATDPQAIAQFLGAIKPETLAIAETPIDAAMHLFYLSTAEHLPLNMNQELRNFLIVDPAVVYLKPLGPLSLRMRQLFETANAALLAVISCPSNEKLTAHLVPFYIDTLTRAFPAHLSPRQFRLAFKTLIKVVSPPNPIYDLHNRLCEVAMEMLRQGVEDAGDAFLPSPTGEEHGPPVSEKSTLVLAMMDALPLLAIGSFEEWLTRTALSVNFIKDRAARDVVEDRFHRLTKDGEWDSLKAPVFIHWWTGKGGEDAVLFGTGSLMEGEPLMSGAILPSGSSALAHF